MPFVLCCLLLSQATAAPTAPQTVRIVILDVSGSMQGPRLTTAIEELRTIARHMPPSAEHPIVMIPFDQAVVERQVATYRDAPSFALALARIQIGGGTRIAAGLERAFQELTPYQHLPHVMVMLYTDGEDNDQQGILAAEEKLNRLFAQRSKQGLGQMMVFCKRWENANKALIQKLTEHGNVTIADAGELKLLPVLLTPQVKVLSSTWQRQPLALVINVELGIDSPAKLTLPALRTRCLTPGVQGDLVNNLVPMQPKRVQLKLPLQHPVPKEVTLRFGWAQPTPGPSGNYFILPHLTRTVVDVAIPVPILVTNVTYSAELAGSQPAYWKNPMLRQLAIPLLLTFHHSADQPLQGSRFRIVPQGPYQLESTPVVSMEGNGTKRIPLTVISQGILQSPLSISLKLLPEATSLVTFQPAEIIATCQVPIPSPVTTTITIQPLQVRSVVWTDLVHALAEAQIDVEFRVEGPLKPGTVLTLKTTGVKRFEFQPNTVQTGTQVVKLTLEGPFLGNKSLHSFTFDCEPPAEQGAVRIAKPLPLTVQFASPPPVPLLLLHQGAFARQWELSLGDQDQEGSLAVQPLPHGQLRAHAADGLSAQVTFPQAFDSSPSQQFPAGAMAGLTIKRPSGALPSFFIDSVTEGEVLVEPYPPTPAVRGSRYLLKLRVEAPFRRILFWLGLSIGALLMVFGLIRLVLRLRSVETLHEAPDALTVQ